MPEYRVRVLTVLLIALSVRSAAADADSPPELRAVLRADWTQPSSSTWDGRIRLSEGKLESVRALQLSVGQVDIVAPSDDNEIHFRSDGPTAWAGVEFTINAPAQAQVEMELDGQKLTAPFSEVLQGVSYHIDSTSQARLRRSVADILPVRVSRTPLIFAPGETIEFEVELRLFANVPTVSTCFQVALRRGRGGDWLFTREAKFNVPINDPSAARRTAPVTVRMPSDEGVYDLVIRAESDDKHVTERIVQFVVLNTSAASGSTELETRLVQEIDPSQPTSTERWYSTRRLRARTSRIGQFLWTSVRHPFTQSDHGKESPLVTYHLNIDNPGRPHLVSIEYENCGNMLLAAAVSEASKRGEWTQLPITSGIRTEEKPASNGVQSHQLAFWPQTCQPTITLSVDGSAGLSAVKKIRVLELPSGLPVLNVSEVENARRFFGLYLDNPDVWASWSSGRALDSSTHLPIDDWHTFLDAMTHLAEYARFAGHNSMLVTVIGGGGALYPSTTLDLTNRLDTGQLADTACDPVQKDVVELFLRICQRYRLSFFPSIRFDGAIASLDRMLIGADARATGLLLVSRNGTVWDGSESSASQRYNPLNPQVQAAMLEVVRELAERYAGNTAWEGLALDLASNTHAVLPSLDWGYDDATVERFCQESGLELPAQSSDDPDRFSRRHQILTTTAREQWTAWRCRQLHGFYESVLAELQRVKPRGVLFVNLRTLTEPGAEDARESGRTGRTLEDSLRSKGIDLRNWTAPSGIVVLRPFVASVNTPEGLKLNASREIDDLLAQLPSRGSLCIHGPEMLNLAPPFSNDDKTADAAAELLAVPVTAPGRSNIRRYAQSLAAGDCSAIFEGGPVVPLGNEQVQREFARVFRSLPPTEFKSVETLQPVIVRSCRESRDTLIYLVNDASYSVDTSVAFNCSTQAVLSNGASGDRLTTRVVDQGLGTRLSLEPFQTLFLKLSGSEAKVVQCEVLNPQAAERGLKVRFDRLKQAMDIMGSDASRTLDGLPPNGDFEELSNDMPARWSAEGDKTQLSADSHMLHGGSHSLRLAGPVGSTVTSDFFAPPDGRALAMNVWLRASRPGMRVRWFLAGEHGNDPVYHADVTLGTNWDAKQFRARDLPDGPMRRIQVKFQLLDEGTLWVDEARVCALPISQDEKLAISKSVSAIYKAWRERRWSDFERLSDGYWPTYLVETVEAAKGQ